MDYLFAYLLKTIQFLRYYLLGVSDCHDSFFAGTPPTITMESVLAFPVLLTILSFVFQPAEAYTFGVGDGLAIVFFLIIAIIGICAFLGWIARKRAGH